MNYREGYTISNFILSSKEVYTNFVYHSTISL